MTEYSRMAKGTFTSTGGAQIINLPFIPDYVEITNLTQFLTPVTAGIPKGYWDKNFSVTVSGTTYNPTAAQVVTASTLAMVPDIILTNGITTFSAGQLLQFGATQQVASITKANPAVVTVTGHGYTTGDVVTFQGLYSTQFTAGMPQIAGIPFTITVIDANSFSIPWNTNQSAYTALSASPTGATVKKVLYPSIYFPGVSIISNITLGATTTIDTTSAHNFVVGQEVAFRIPVVNGFPTAWGTTQLNSLPNNLTPGAPAYGYVVAVTDYNTVVVNINSSSFTTFNSNVPVANTVGMSFPQIVAVGDINTGGVQISANSPLYPSPYSVPIGTAQVPTINGPAILGAYVNNTAQGFVVGSGTAQDATTAVLVGSSGDFIEWRAFLHDMSIPF